MMQNLAVAKESALRIECWQKLSDLKLRSFEHIGLDHFFDGLGKISCEDVQQAIQKTIDYMPHTTSELKLSGITSL